MIKEDERMNSAATVGNLHPEDDYMHAVSEHPSHNESMFFNFFDSEQALGGFVRIGNRPNEGVAEMTFCLFLPGGELLMQWAKPAIPSNDAFSAAGLKFQVLEPGRRLSISYTGDAVRIKNPLEMREPGKAMRGNPALPTRLKLDVTGVGPMIGDREGTSPDAVIFLDGVGHYQQAIAATGELSVGEDVWTVNAKGVRDHSWGPRLWHSILRDRSLWISFGEELTLIACKTWLAGTDSPSVVPTKVGTAIGIQPTEISACAAMTERDDTADEMGCVIEHGKVTPLRSITMRTHFAPDSYYHDQVVLDVTDVNGRSFHVPGTVLAYVPLRHRKEGQETVYLGQAMTRFEWNGRHTIGLSEYFDAESTVPALIEHSRRGEFVTE
jgi:hypothetical protein